MKLRIDPEFAALIPPLSDDERADLERAIVAFGAAHEPIETWHGLIVDGHNRYAICTEHDLPFTVRELDFPDRDSVKAYMFEHQIARRNLSEEQVIMLAAMRGIPTTRGTALKRERAAVLAAADKGAPVLAGKLTIALAYGAHMPRTPKPYVPRGPTATIPAGHELAGKSTLTGPDGEVKATWDKTRVHGADEPPTPVPESFHMKRASVMQRGDGTTVVQWASYEPEQVQRFEAIKAAIVEHVATYMRPLEPLTAPAATDATSADLLVCYPLGDPHIGMLAWANEVTEHFDVSIAQRELCECMRQLVARAPAAERAIVVNLGDFWHAQDDTQRTPGSGHKLDVDGRAGKVASIGLAILETLIDTALQKHARVEFRSLPGNHDPTSSFWLPEAMRRTYSGEPRVTMHEGFNPYQFDEWGACALGWAHGDGAKLETLGEIMATDAPELWGRSRFRYWNTGHIHHWSEKELRGCVVSTHRTLAGRDAWHHHSGYRSGRALKAVAYHREWGLDSVAVVGVERVRAALAGAR